MIPDEIQAFDLGPIPKTERFSGLLGWGEELQRINIEDLSSVLQQLQAVADAEELPDELRELLGTEILSKVMAYRHPEDFFRQTGQKIAFPLHLRDLEGSYATYNYELAERIPLLGGTSALLFISDDGAAPAQLLFHGTISFPALHGAEMTLIEDVNPFGPGAAITTASAKRIEEALAEVDWAVVHGHSLGGCLALRFALRFPKILRRVWSHNSPRYSYGSVRRWNEMDEALRPELRNLVASYDDLGDDFVTSFGDLWLGEVERLHSSRRSEGNLIQRARRGHQQMLLNDPATRRIKVEEHGYRHFWSATQRVGALIAYLPMLLTMTLTRVLFRKRPSHTRDA